MRSRRIRAVVGRDLTVALGSKAVVLPALIVPAVLLVILPLAVGLTTRFTEMASLGDLQVMLEALPQAAIAGLPEDTSAQVAYLLVTYVMSPLVLLVPVMLSAVIAADGMAGEQERGTLEGLLLTPLSDAELASAKLLAAWVPATVLGIGGAIVYAVVANLSVAGQVGRLVLITPEYMVMSLWTGPTFAAVALAAVSLVSVRVKTTQEAFQVGGIVVLPVVGLVIGQSAGLLLLSVWFLVAAGVVALLLAAALVAISGRSLSRTRLGERLG